MREVMILLLILAAIATGIFPRQSQAEQMITTANSSASGQTTLAQADESYGKLPISFEANRGQTDDRVKFLSRAGGYTLFLTPTEAVLALSGRETRSKERGAEGGNLQAEKAKFGLEPRKMKPAAVLRMKLAGARPSPEVVGLDELPGKANYFIGNDPQKWRVNIPTYARVQYQAVYPGVDLVYYGNRRQLEYDFVVTPGADPNIIKLVWAGARKVWLDENGDLLLDTAGGAVRWLRPVVYQEAGGERKLIAGAYALTGKRQVGFRVGKYDTSKPLIIDPGLVYSTYLGGLNQEKGSSIAADARGNAYLTGSTNSPDFPTSGIPPQPTLKGDYDVFVSKLNSTGSALIYSTYLGGNDLDRGWGIAVDGSGNAYVTGETRGNFPLSNPIQALKGGGACKDGRFTVDCTDAFVAKLNSTGSALVFSTFLGGKGEDVGYGIAVDPARNVHVTGYTYAKNFPTMNAFQPALKGSNDVFVTKLDTTRPALIFSTYLGGGGQDAGFSIAADSSGNSYVTGITRAADFPTVSPLQPSRKGVSDAIVSKLNGIGSLVFSTFLGGGSWEKGYGISVDANGQIYITGDTESTDFPTLNPLQPTRNGAVDAFVTKLQSAGGGFAFAYSTYLGGSSLDRGFGIAVDSDGNAYVAGGTESPDFPVLDPIQPFLGGHVDAIVTKLNAVGSEIIYSTYLGGHGEDVAYGIAVDNSINRKAYVTGWTLSINFPTKNPLQPALNGASDAFVAKIGDFRLTVTVVGSGSVASNPVGISCLDDCVHDYPAGTAVTLTATPDPNWKFDHWEAGCSGAVNTCTVTMTSNRSVRAVFTEKVIP